MPQGPDFTVKLWMLPLHTFGVRCWIDCDAVQGYTGAWGSKPHFSQNAFVLLEACERASALLGFTPSLVGRKASTDTSQSFVRCLDAHSLSATGLLLALMHLSTRTRGEAKDNKKVMPKRLLEGLLHIAFKEEQHLYLEQSLGLVDATCSLVGASLSVPYVGGALQVHVCALQPLQVLLQKQGHCNGKLQKQPVSERAVSPLVRIETWCSCAAFALMVAKQVWRSRIPVQASCYVLCTVQDRAGDGQLVNFCRNADIAWIDGWSHMSARRVQ
eukprot:3774301-Amphidinium_carterae.4